jgi:hypothetical protein
MKLKNILLIFVLMAVLFVGCAKNDTTTPPATTPQVTTAPQTTTAPPTTPPEATPDVATTASIVNTEAAFENAISSKGTWIICPLKNLTFNKELVVEGEYKNGKKDAAGKDIIQRKIGLYTQDENRKVTSRFTLTAPKMTFNSPMGSIEQGTFKGDLYVSANNFQLKGATVDGNVYFTTDEAKSTFKMDADSKITGKQEVKK